MRSWPACRVPSWTWAVPRKRRSKPTAPLRITCTRIGPAAAGRTVASRLSGAPAMRVPTSRASSRGRMRTVNSFEVTPVQATWNGPGLPSRMGIRKVPSGRTWPYATKVVPFSRRTRAPLAGGMSRPTNSIRWRYEVAFGAFSVSTVVATVGPGRALAAAGHAASRTSTSARRTRKSIGALSAENGHERDRVEEGVDGHPRVDARGTRPDECEAGPEDDQDRQRLEQAVVDAERDSDPEDRDGLAERLEERVAEPAERQLLDHGREERDHDEVRGERSCVRRLPMLRGQALLAFGVGEGADDRGDDVRGRQCQQAEPGGPAPRRRRPQREQLPPRAG